MLSGRQVLAAAVALLAVALAAWGLMWLLPRIWSTIVLLLLSAILATGLAPLVTLVQGPARARGAPVPASVAILVIYLLFFIGAALFLVAVFTTIAAEAGRFLTTLPAYFAHLQRFVTEMQTRAPLVARLLGPESLETLTARLPQQLSSVLTQVTVAAGVAARFLDSVFSLTMVLVFTYYMLVSGSEMKRGFLVWWPPQLRPQVERVLRGIGVKFGGWLRGQIVLLLIAFAITTVGLTALRLPYPILLGALSALLELIPIVGPAAAAIPALLVALFLPTWQLAGVVLLYVLLFQLLANVFGPRVMGKTVGLSPIVTLAVLLVGAQLAGIIGAVIAIPVAAAVQVIAGEILDVVRAQWGESEVLD